MIRYICLVLIAITFTSCVLDEEALNSDIKGQWSLASVEGETVHEYVMPFGLTTPSLGQVESQNIDYSIVFNEKTEIVTSSGEYSLSTTLELGSDEMMYIDTISNAIKAIYEEEEDWLYTSKPLLPYTLIGYDTIFQFDILRSRIKFLSPDSLVLHHFDIYFDPTDELEWEGWSTFVEYKSTWNRNN